MLSSIIVVEILLTLPGICAGIWHPTPSVTMMYIEQEAQLSQRDHATHCQLKSFELLYSCAKNTQGKAYST